MYKSVLITGANAGLGKESARQLAESSKVESIILGCRNLEKANIAKKELETVTGKKIFQILQIDVSDLDSVRNAVSSLNKPLDALIMNAGGMGGKNFNNLTKYGVTEQFAVNVLGHYLLLKELLKEGKLTKIALYAGSEVARGVPKMMLKRPSFKNSSVEEFKEVINGTRFKGIKDPLVPYGPTKFLAALWISYMSRQHQNIKFITVSPGSTSGTDIGKTLRPFMKLMFTVVGPKLLPLFKLIHSVEKGAARYIKGLFDSKYESGKFYASKASILTGPMVEQSTIFPDLANEVYQENAIKAIESYL